MINYNFYDETEAVSTGDIRVYDNTLFEALSNISAVAIGDASNIPVFNKNWKKSTNNKYIDVVEIDKKTSLILLDLSVDDITLALPNPELNKDLKVLIKISSGGNSFTLTTHDSGTFIDYDTLSISYANLTNVKQFYTTGIGWTKLSSDGIMSPFLSSSNNVILFTDVTDTITLIGDNFDNNMEVFLGNNVTVNSVTAISPTELIVSYTTTSALQAGDNISITRDNVPHFGQNIQCIVTDVVTGTGVAGNFLTNFTSGGVGEALWGSDWQLEIFGLVNSIDQYFMSSSAGTPSGSTGPTAGYDGNYAFIETSNPNNGVGNYGQVTTTNFNELTQISFMYHMFGSAMGALVLYSQNVDNSWTERWRRDGQQQTAQGDAFLSSGNIDASTWGAMGLRFVFEAPSGYQGDICLDDISIVSI